jgi:hypothetical protein
MMAKLDRLPISEEVKVWDLSLLSPEDQDRARDLMDLFLSSTDIEAEGLKAAIIEFESLVEGLPLLGENDRRQGPKIEVPMGLEYYWRWQQKASEWRNYNFYELKKVQILRFVELCEQYGYREGNTREMAPIDEWEPVDREELTELLDAASAPRQRIPTPSHLPSGRTGGKDTEKIVRRSVADACMS